MPQLVSGHSTLIYDGECALCGLFVSLVTRWDRGRRIVLCPFQDERQTATLAVPGDRAREAACLVAPDGTISYGAKAISSLLKLLPGGYLVGALLDVPGLRTLADRGYRWVADNRGALSARLPAQVGRGDERDDGK